jgi:hypothetical protein
MMRARTTFRVIDGVVAEGRDALLHYVDHGGVLDLLRTFELADGWYEFSALDGMTRAIRAATTAPKHAHHDGNNVPIRPKQGTSRAYIDRLQRQSRGFWRSPPPGGAP